jgi:hypothetical protein
LRKIGSIVWHEDCWQGNNKDSLPSLAAKVP